MTDSRQSTDAVLVRVSPEIQGLRAEIERLRDAIREHRDALDARALGDPDQIRRDRDDIDDDLYWLACFPATSLTKGRP